MRCYFGKISATLPLQKDSTYVLLEKNNTLYVYVKDKYVIKIITEPYIFLTEEQNFFITGITRRVISEEKYKKYFLSERFRSGFGESQKGDKGLQGPTGNKGPKGQTGPAGNPATIVPINTFTYQTKNDKNIEGDIIQYNGEELDHDEKYVTTYDSKNENMCEILYTAHDCNGNTFICGYFKNSITLGNFQLQTGNVKNGFVAMIRSDNETMWVLPITSTEECEAVAIVADDSNNLYVTGTLRTEAFFGSIAKNVYAGKHTFLSIIEYTETSAHWKWVTSTASDVLPGSVDKDDSAYVEVCDIAYTMGKIIISGHVHGYIQLIDNYLIDESAVTYNRKHIQNTSLYICVINPLAVYHDNQTIISEENNIWYFVLIENTNNIFPESMAIYDNNIYVGGRWVNQNKNNLFIQRFEYVNNKNISSRWKRYEQIPFTITKITVDLFQNLYIVGYYTHAFEIPDIFVKREGNIKPKTAFLAKLNNVGAWEAFLDITSAESMITGIKTDSDQNMYICGNHSGTVTLPLFNGPKLIPQDTYASCFLCKISRYGQWQWGIKISTDFYANMLSIDSDKNLHLVGYYKDGEAKKATYNRVIKTLPRAIIQEKNSINTTVSFLRGRLFDMSDLITGKYYSLDKKSSKVVIYYGYINNCGSSSEQNNVIGIAINDNKLLIGYI